MHACEGEAVCKLTNAKVRPASGRTRRASIDPSRTRRARRRQRPRAVKIARTHCASAPRFFFFSRPPPSPPDRLSSTARSISRHAQHPDPVPLPPPLPPPLVAGALLQRPHRPREQDPGGQGGGDLRSHQRVHVSIKMSEGVVASSYKKGDLFHISPDKLLPMERFLPQKGGGGGGGGRGGRGGGEAGAAGAAAAGAAAADAAAADDSAADDSAEAAGAAAEGVSAADAGAGAGDRSGDRSSPPSITDRGGGERRGGREEPSPRRARRTR